jgi:ABC-type branched-subunit amino acid transport system ATPase component
LGEDAIPPHDGLLCQIVDGVRSFGAVQALAGVNLEIHSGEVLGIVGPNGSGKTTLFNCLTGRYRLTRGQVLWRGVDITRWPMERIARAGLVRTFQQSMHFPSASVRENVAMALNISRSTPPRKGGSVIPEDLAGLLEFTRMEAIAGVPSAALSHGSLRQLGIALALAVRPTLLLLDEPAAGLNDAESRDLGALLRRIQDGGVTLVVVDHDMDFVMPLVDRLAVLSAGRKLAEGTPAEMRADARVVSAYLGSGFGGPASANRTADQTQRAEGA